MELVQTPETPPPPPPRLRDLWMLLICRQIIWPAIAVVTAVCYWLVTKRFQRVHVVRKLVNVDFNLTAWWLVIVSSIVLVTKFIVLIMVEDRLPNADAVVTLVLSAIGAIVFVCGFLLFVIKRD